MYAPRCSRRTETGGPALRHVGYALGLLIATWGGSGPAHAIPELVAITNFQGSKRDCPLCIPPDTMGAKGPGYFVELLNNAFATYLPNGTLVQRTSLPQFWDDAFLNAFNNPPPHTGSPPPRQFANSPFDPRILYDHISKRWYAVSVDGIRSADSRILVAVTTGMDPSPGNWRGFAIKADPDEKLWADFPTLGYNNKGVYIAANMEPIAGRGANPTRVLIGIPKASLTAPSSGIGGAVTQRNIPGHLGTLQPAVDLPQFGFGYKAFSVHQSIPNTIEAHTIPDSFLSGVPLGMPTSITVPGDPLKSPPNINYSPSSNLEPIDTGPLHLSSNVVQGFFSNWAVVAVKDLITSGSAIRWLEIDGNTNQVLHAGGLFAENLELFYPSIAINGWNEIVIGFAAMPDGHPFAPGGWVAVGQIGLNNTPEFSTVISSVALSSDPYEVLDLTGSTPRNRWGDYSATTYDVDTGAFWTIQEYASAENVWSTRIASFYVKNDFGDTKVPGAGAARGTYGSMGPQKYSDDFAMDGMRLRGRYGFFNLPDELTDVGDMAIEEYDLLLDAVLRTGSDMFELRGLPAHVKVKFTLTFVDDQRKLFDSEMLSLILQDQRGLPFDFSLGLDPDRASLGQLMLLTLAPGDTRVKSYFDLFTIFGIDSDHLLGTAQPTHLFLRAPQVAEPSTLLLVGLGMLGLLGHAWRRRRVPLPRVPTRQSVG